MATRGLEIRCTTAQIDSTQADLFGAPEPPGLSYAADVVTPDEERRLIALIDAQDVAPFRFHAWRGKRLTVSFGWSYDYGTASFTAPIPDWLLPLRERAARHAAIAPDAFAQALLIRYDPGAGIGWHRDRPVYEHVAGISLGARATMRFRQRTADGFARAAVPLAPRSIYHLGGAARHGWEHSIAPMDVTRWSITFRSLSDKGRAMGRQSPATR